MKETGILRRIDELGRIVIPKEIRKKLKIREGDNLDIYVSEDNIILKKYSLLKDLETIIGIMFESLNNLTLVLTNLDHVIASNNKDIRINDTITQELIDKIIQKETIIINKNYPFKITDGNYSNSHLVIKPILLYGDVFGSLIMFSDFDLTNQKNEMFELVHNFCIEYLKV